MNEFYSSLFLLISEVGLFLLLILGTILVMARSRNRKDKALAMVLVDKIRKAEPEKREKLLALLKEEYGYDDEKAEEKIEQIMGQEKNLYNTLIQIFLKKKRERIAEFDSYLNELIESYQNVQPAGDGDDDESGDSRSSTLVITREENSNLRAANKKLKKDLDAAMQTMESMMAEYASMYEGGKKEGEQRMKNEMFKLRQVLEEKVDEDDVDEGEVEDMELDIDDVHIDLDSEENTEKIKPD